MRRRFRQLGLFLLLGAIVNVVLSWTAALWLPAAAGFIGVHEETHGDGVVALSFVQGGVASTAVRTSFSTVSALENELGPGFPLTPLPGWCADPGRGKSLRQLEPTNFIQVAWGWPCRSMSCRIEEHIEDVPGFVRDDPPMIPGLDVLPQIGGTRWVSEMSWQFPLTWLQRPDDATVPLASGGAMPRCLPLRVLPLGFLMNAVLYAAGLWLFLVAPFTVRRLVRRRSGRCVHCGYLIGSNEVCTECGNAVPAARRSGGRAIDAR